MQIGIGEQKLNDHNKRTHFLIQQPQKTVEHDAKNMKLQRIWQLELAAGIAGSGYAASMTRWIYHTRLTLQIDQESGESGFALNPIRCY